MLNWDSYDDLEIEAKREKTNEYIDVVKKYTNEIFTNPSTFLKFLNFIAYQFNDYNIWTLIYLYGKSIKDKTLQQGYTFFKVQFEEYHWMDYVNTITDKDVIYVLGNYFLEDSEKNKIFFYELINVKNNIHITQDLANKKLRYIDKDLKDVVIDNLHKLLLDKGYVFKENEAIKTYGGIIDIDNKTIYISRDFNDDTKFFSKKWNYYLLWYLMSRELENNMQLELEKKRNEILLMQKFINLYCKVSDIWFTSLITDLDFLGEDVFKRMLNFENIYEKVLEILKEISNANNSKTN
ncbi:hypothetical protein [Mycoplasma sp. Z1473D]